MVIPVDFGVSSGEYGAVVVIPMDFVARMDSVASGAPAVPSAQTVITNPDWIRGPGPNIIGPVYPAKASINGQSGAAKIKCIVTVKGALDRCVVVEESPPGWGFGSAALALSQYFAMRPRIVDGIPAGDATVVIPIRFDLPDGPATHLIDAPVWASRATPAQIAAAFPTDRLGTTDEEHVTLRCKVLADGGMGHCTTTEDDPSFRAAALSLAKDYRLSALADGRSPAHNAPDNAYVDLSILFKASDAVRTGR